MMLVHRGRRRAALRSEETIGRSDLTRAGTRLKRRVGDRIRREKVCHR